MLEHISQKYLIKFLFHYIKVSKYWQWNLLVVFKFLFEDTFYGEFVREKGNIIAMFEQCRKLTKISGVLSTCLPCFHLCWHSKTLKMKDHHHDSIHTVGYNEMILVSKINNSWPKIFFYMVLKLIYFHGQIRQLVN